MNTDILTAKRVTQVEFFHLELQQVQSAISFYRDELNILSTRLAEVVKNNTHENVLSQAEHYQNQFIVQNRELDLLLHDIRRQEAVVKQAVETNQPLSPLVIGDEAMLRERIQFAEKIWLDTKHQFYLFLASVF